MTTKITKEIKKSLAKVLAQMGIIKTGFTGQIILNLQQGGISNLERRESL
jgi:hypothetical protein